MPSHFAGGSRAEPEWRSTARAATDPVVVWLVWGAATIATILYIRHYGRNIPYFEDFFFVPVMAGHEPLSLQWAAVQCNEHRPVIPKLILGSLLRAVPDFRAGLYLNAGMMSAGAASLIVLAKRLRGRSSVVDAVLPLAILNIGQFECLLIGFALNLVVTAWISCALIVAVSRAHVSPGWRCLEAGGLIVLLPLCGGSGLAMLPPLILWLAGYIACSWWSRRDPGAWARAIGVALLMTTSAIVAWYLSGYVKPAHVPAAQSARSVWSTTLEFLSLVISPSGWGYWRPAGLAVFLLTAATVVHLVVVARRAPVERPRALGLIAVLSSMICVAAAVGLSRSGLGPGTGLNSRYVTISAPLLGVLYVTWLIYGTARAQRAVHTGLLALVCAGIPAQARFARAAGEGRRAFYVKLERGLKRGVPTSRLVDLACPALFPHRPEIDRAFKVLKTAGVGKFRCMVDDGLAARQETRTRIR